MDEVTKFNPKLPWSSRDGERVSQVWQQALIEPVRDFLSRPSKAIRHRLVAAGYRIASGEGGELSAKAKRLCLLAGTAIEAIHAGSLVIDDIQDGSVLRRGAPTVHRNIGMPLALNVGNWLYFWPLAEIESWGIPAQQELLVYRACHRALLHAHYGQALDVGTPMLGVPKDQVDQLCMKSLELKTGALMALATSLGAILGGMSSERVSTIEKHARSFGVSLQMFDDLGNLLPRKVNETADPKRWEDLRLGRPSWVWAVIARTATEEQYDIFREAVSAFPIERKMENFLADGSFYRSGKAAATNYMMERIKEWDAEIIESSGKSAAMKEILGIAEQLKGAYER